MNQNAIRFEHVDVVFGQNAPQAVSLLDQGLGRDAILDKTACLVAVHDASVFVNEGEILVLMGLSGSGKSSLLRCVNGLNTVTRGKVLVNDGNQQVDVASCDPETLRRVRRNRISMVFQQFGLMPWLTVRDNVGFGLDIRGVSKAERDRIVDDKIKLVRLDKFANKFTHELSGGMQQRVGLARAFATEADILLMDEPFSALDPLIREHLQDELIELQQKLKKTIVFVSHDLDEALKIGNRIAIMESGRIVQVGTPEEIVTAPANEYVANFVANVNPLNVLRGSTLMRPLRQLERHGDWIVIDAVSGMRCRLDEVDMPVAVLENGVERPVVRVKDGSMPTPGAVCADAADLPMRRAVELVHATHRPVILVDGDGRMVGVIAGEEIVQGLLRQERLPA